MSQAQLAEKKRKKEGDIMETEGKYEDLHEVNLRSAGRKVWLVKVPNFLAEAWKKMPVDSELGKVRITQKGPNNEVSLALSGPSVAEGPKDYKLVVSTVQQPIYIFAEDDQGNVSIEGTVKNRGDVQAERFDEYRRLVRARSEKAAQKPRQVQTVEDTREVAIRADQHARIITTTHMGSANRPAVVTTVHRRVRPMSPPKVLDKRERMEKTELIDLIFTKFEKRTMYTFKELIQLTDQPSAFLKEVLNEICIYNKRGPNKSTYELKPEYKKSGLSKAM